MFVPFNLEQLLRTLLTSLLSLLLLLILLFLKNQLTILWEMAFTIFEETRPGILYSVP